MMPASYIYDNALPFYYYASALTAYTEPIAYARLSANAKPVYTSILNTYHNPTIHARCTYLPKREPKTF